MQIAQTETLKKKNPGAKRSDHIQHTCASIARCPGGRSDGGGPRSRWAAGHRTRPVRYAGSCSEVGVPQREDDWRHDGGNEQQLAVASDESRSSAGRPKRRQLSAVPARGTDGER